MSVTQEDVFNNVDSEGGQGEVWELFAQLYPLGPLQENIWTRAGGEISRLSLSSRDSARAHWFSALELIGNGGGGTSLQRLADTALSDHPNNEQIKALVARLNEGDNPATGARPDKQILRRAL